MIINAVTVLAAARTDLLNTIQVLAAAPALHAILLLYRVNVTSAK